MASQTPRPQPQTATDPKQSQYSTGDPHSLTPEQAAAALNEHGFLLQQAVREKIASYAGNPLKLGAHWKLQGYEYPVQAPDNSETTIDLLLKGGSTYLCLECKRPHAGYKHWIFFDSTPFQNSVACHTWIEASGPTYDGRGHKRQIDRLPAPKTPSFQHFLEVTISHPTKDGQVKKRSDHPATEKLSRTDGLHASFRQAITATSGLVTKILRSEGSARAVPVIVTTAQLYGCLYPPDKIDSETGKIAADEIKLTPHPFISVQYSAPESLALKEDLTAHERAPGLNDLMNCILRTVYVVRVHNINDFLFWAGHHLL